MASKLSAKQALVEYEVVVAKIAVVRGQRVMFAQDLAELYGVETRVLMQAVKRNIDRFPKDFLFQLTDQEFTNLRSQFVTSSLGGIRKLPYALSEQGVAMLSSILRSPRAVAVKIEIMRSFVRMRALIEGNRVLAKKISDLEKKYDKPFKQVFEAIYDLMDDGGKKRKIGFV